MRAFLGFGWCMFGFEDAGEGAGCEEEGDGDGDVEEVLCQHLSAYEDQDAC